jgi:hypothetical protein
MEKLVSAAPVTIAVKQGSTTVSEKALVPMKVLKVDPSIVIDVEVTVYTPA